MNESGKAILLILAIVYFISPVDLAPGLLIDDFVALAIASARTILQTNI